jgi:hypothetical protein
MTLSSKIRAGLKLTVFFLSIVFSLPTWASEPIQVTSNPGDENISLETGHLK